MVTPEQPGRLPTVVVAGATGFVGRAICEALSATHHVVGLTRRPEPGQGEASGMEWRQCDLFSLLEVEQAMRGANYAVYLVHSMLPSSRLTQGSFADFDLILADNFARAAEAAGVRQIVYLGGLIPAERQLSPHLASRLEVEETLKSRRTPLTALRAGIVVGPNGSSLRMVVNLVRRLPVMLLPRWTQSLTQPVALADVVRAVRAVLGREECLGRRYDLGGPDVMTYREMLQRTAAQLGERCRFWEVPVFTPGVSKLWISVVGGAPYSLVSPLVDSLRHSLVAEANPLLAELSGTALTFEQALQVALDPAAAPAARRHRASRHRTAEVITRAKRVRSVQRLPLPPGWTARRVAQEYYRWLPSCVWPAMRCQADLRGHCRFYLRGVKRLLLELSLSAERSEEHRQLFYITGGLLARRDNAKARFEFRETSDGRWVIAAIHDYAPTLPWYVYNATQALIHLAVMRAFGRHLCRCAGREASGQGLMTRTR